MQVMQFVCKCYCNMLLQHAPSFFVFSLVEEISRDPDAALSRPSATSTTSRNDRHLRRPHSIYGHLNPPGGHVLGHSRGNGVLQLAHNANLSCLLATADSELALKTHYLYEVGGNIGEFLLILHKYFEKLLSVSEVLFYNDKSSVHRFYFISIGF